MRTFIGTEDVEGQEKAFVEFVVECEKMLWGELVVETLAAFVGAWEGFIRVEPGYAAREGRGDAEGHPGVVVGEGEGRASGRVVDAALKGGFGAAGEFIYEGTEAAKSGSRSAGQDLSMGAILGLVREDGRLEVGTEAIAIAKEVGLRAEGVAQVVPNGDPQEIPRGTGS